MADLTIGILGFVALFGIAVTMAAGLYIVMRERSMARTPPLEQP